jgi:hypothetical protein
MADYYSKEDETRVNNETCRETKKLYLTPSIPLRQNGDGISVSVNGTHWVRVTDLTSSFTAQSFDLTEKIEDAKEFADSNDVSCVWIKLQQYDNTFEPNDGREFDNIKIIANAVLDSQDFESGLPQSWSEYSDNEGRIQVLNGRLRMDDYGENYDYSLNEVIDSIGLAGKTNVKLTLDHSLDLWSLNDENDGLPETFTGHYNGDGIAYSMDGTNWKKVANQALLLNFQGL